MMLLDKLLGGGYKRRMNFRDRMAVFLATGLSLGKIPLAPGTFGTLLGIPVCYALSELGLVGSLVGVLVVVLAAVPVAGRAEDLIGEKDAPAIVIDEVAGMTVTMAGLPISALNLAAGFMLFRALDVLKPFPARRIERNLSGGWGIVLDDVAAGLYSNFLLRGIAIVFFQGTLA